MLRMISWLSSVESQRAARMYAPLPSPLMRYLCGSHPSAASARQRSSTSLVVGLRLQGDRNSESKSSASALWR